MSTTPHTTNTDTTETAITMALSTPWVVAVVTSEINYILLPMTYFVIVNE